MAELAVSNSRGSDGGEQASQSLAIANGNQSGANLSPERGEYLALGLESYRGIHRELYPAREHSGQLRDSVIASDTMRRDAGATAPTIAQQGNAIFREFERRGQLRGMPRAEFVDGLFEHARKLHAWQPFEYGNVEALKEHLGRVGRHAGYSVDLSHIDNRRFEEALNSANAHGRHSELYGILFDQAVPTRALEFTKAMKTGEWDSAVAKHPELRHARELVDRASAQLRSGAGPGQDIDPHERAGSRSPRWNQYHTALRRITSEVYSGRLTTAPEARARARLLNRAPTP